MHSIRRQASRFIIILVASVLIAIDAWAAFTLGSIPTSLTVISVVILVCAAVVGVTFGRSIVKPLANLVPQAEATAEGRLEVSNHGAKEVPEEIQVLANAISQIGEKQARDLSAMKKLEQVRSEFLANVSHELRTPIFAVQGFIETLLDGAIDDPNVNRDFLERAQNQASRLNSLLNDLIDISRIESGEMRMSLRLFDVQPFLRDVVRDMQPIAEHKSIDLYYTGNARVYDEVLVFGDKDRLKQVLINLVDNAIKYTDQGSVKVELAENAPSKGFVTISVRDTGIGIPRQHLSRLFERFYRVDKDRSRSSVGGTGLGLAIVKHIVEAHRGKISVESEPDTSSPARGSVFAFTLHTAPFL